MDNWDLVISNCRYYNFPDAWMEEIEKVSSIQELYASGNRDIAEHTVYWWCADHSYDQATLNRYRDLIQYPYLMFLWAKRNYNNEQEVAFMAGRIPDSEWLYQFAICFPQYKFFLCKKIKTRDTALRWLTRWPEDKKYLSDKI